MRVSRLQFMCPKGLLLTAILALALLPFQAAPCSGAVAYETPVNRSAADILPQQLLSGPHYRVRDKVVSYGYMHRYTVDSDFGEFEVTGDIALRKLIREIGAIAALGEIKKGQAYMDGLKKAASQPLEFGANLITDPVDTVSGIPRGISRLFDNVKTGLSTKAGPGEDSKVEQALAVSSNKRELAKRLGIDVYSSNKVLQKDLNSVAWATSLGSLTVSAALAPVGGAAVAAISVTRAAQQVSDVVNEYPPARLRQMNEQKLLAMGVPSGLVTRFLEHPSYTPTHETVITSSLEALTGAKGRDAFIELALSADDEESANYFENVALTMRGYQQKVAPIVEISVYGPLVFAKASNKVVLLPLPLDYGMWTEAASRNVPRAMAAYAAANPGAKKYEAWFTGTVSAKGKEGIKKLGISLVEHVDNRIDFVY